MATLGLRYPGCGYYHSEIPNITGAAFFGSLASMSDAHFSPGSEFSRTYVAPARYSEVRKVVFAITFIHFQSGGQLSDTVRGRVAISSSSVVSKVVESLSIPKSSIIRVNGSGQQWTNPSQTNASLIYSKLGTNTTIPIQFNVANTQSLAQVLYVEFDRFEADSADFFADWDAIAANGDDDEYIAFQGYVERITGGVWTSTGTGNINNAPRIIGMGCEVVQAPAQVNNSCGSWQATFGAIATGAMTTSFNFFREFPFIYNAAEWDHIEEISLLFKQGIGNAATQEGNFSYQLVTYEQGDSTPTAVAGTDENFNDQDTGIGFVCRSQDLLPFFQDGKIHGVQMKSDTGFNSLVPWAMWQVIQKDFTKKLCVHFGGMSSAFRSTAGDGVIKPSAPPPRAYGSDQSLFDPAWYQNFPDELIFKQHIWGGFLHQSGVNNSDINLAINADPAEDFDGDPFTQLVEPGKASTPNATTGYKIVNAPIQSNNPLNLAGVRGMKMSYGGTSWTGGTQDLPGQIALVYGLDVPNSEFLEQGPVFALGEFNPEGCASTSAGLGDPGLLVITNGSVPPKHFNPAESVIEDNGVPEPFPDEVPSYIAEDTASSPDGGLQAGTYLYRYTFRNCCTGKESNPNPEDIVVDTTGASPAAKVTFSFAGVRIPGDPQICEICLYRTILGGDFPVMAKVGCFDPGQTETFEDMVSDDALDFINDGLSLLNAPMPCVPIVVEFRNRLFGMGDIPQLFPEGTVSVVNGSDIVTGSDDVEWDRCLEGRYIQVEGDCVMREIDRVLPPDAGVSPPIGRLQLVDPYDGLTATGKTYHICGRPNRVYISEPLEPECWPEANFIDVEPGDGDRLMGAVSNFDRLVICKRNKTYVMTFREQPALEVIVPTRISSDIGCIGPRTFAQVESGSVWMSDRGIAIYDGRTVQHLQASDQMSDLFIDPDNDDYIRRDQNGRVIDAVGVFYPKREQYLLLVPTKNTDRGCDLMIVWDVKLNNITILKFCQEFQSMVVGKDAEGNERVYMGDVNGFVWIFDYGDTDGIGFPNDTGTLKGTITDAGLDDVGASFLEDSAASFLKGGLPGLAGLSGVEGLSGAFLDGDLGSAGACVWIRPPGAALDDPYVRYAIYATTQNRVYVSPNWGEDIPEIGSEYILGAIEFRCVFKPANYGTDDFQKRDWRQVVVHGVEQRTSKIRVELLPDFQNSDPEELTVVTEPAGQGRVFDMSYYKGRQVHPVGRLIHNFQAVRISQVDADAPVRLINHLLMTTPRTSK